MTVLAGLVTAEQLWPGTQIKEATPLETAQRHIDGRSCDGRGRLRTTALSLIILTATAAATAPKSTPMVSDRTVGSAGPNNETV